MKWLLKFFKNLLIILLIPGIIYSLLVIIGGLIPVNNDFNSEGTVSIFLIENGAHTDIVLPVKNELMNWEKLIRTDHFLNSSGNSEYYAFGWGDLEFYRSTPNWEDFNINIAARSIFLDTPSAIHVTRINKPEGKRLVELEISVEQYEKLTEYILMHFDLDSKKKVQLLDFHYSENDVFYKSRASFHAFRTCNTWVNNALKYAGLKACLWTPFSKFIFWQYTSQ